MQDLITIEEAVNFVGQSINKMEGGEIFIPKMKSMKIINCIKVLPKAKINNIGIRPGEKIHETLIHQETKNVFDWQKLNIIQFYLNLNFDKKNISCEKTKDKFEYSSNTNKFGSKIINWRELFFEKI